MRHDSDRGARQAGWLTDERLRLYPGALFLALVIAFLFTVITADGAETVTGTLGGDYAAFHGVAELYLDGRSEEIYDWAAQAEAQRGLHPEESDSFLAFAYPPFLVLLYAALAPLGFQLAYTVHTVLAGLALWGVVVMVSPMLPRLGRHRFAIFVVMLLFFPLFRAIPGGQNTSLSLFLLVGAWRSLYDGRDVLAGFSAGLLLFKPQLGIPLVGLIVLRRRPRVLLGLGLAAGLLYVLGAVVGGPGWIGWWWSQISQFHLMDQDVNAGNSVGVLGWLEAVLGPGSLWALIPGAVCMAVLVGMAMALWATDRVAPIVRLGLTSVVLVLIPPHAMFYDAGLGALGLLVWADRASHPTAVGVVWGASYLAVLSGVLGSNPLFLVLLAIAVGLLLDADHADARLSDTS